MITYSNKTLKENVTSTDGDVTMNGSIEHSDGKLISANFNNINVGSSFGYANIDMSGNVSLSGFKSGDIEAASSAVAGWIDEINLHINGSH